MSRQRRSFRNTTTPAFTAATRKIGQSLDDGLDVEQRVAHIERLGFAGRRAGVLAILDDLRRIANLPEDVLQRIEADADTPIDQVIARVRAEAGR